MLGAPLTRSPFDFAKIPSKLIIKYFIRNCAYGNCNLCFLCYGNLDGDNFKPSPYPKNVPTPMQLHIVNAIYSKWVMHNQARIGMIRKLTICQNSNSLDLDISKIQIIKKKDATYAQ